MRCWTKAFTSSCTNGLFDWEITAIVDQFCHGPIGNYVINERNFVWGNVWGGKNKQ